MSINGESTAPSSPPAPMIGKIGPYTVFVTPPPTPKPTASTPHSHHNSPLSSSIPRRFDSPQTQSRSPPPVLPPPVHYSPKDDASSFAFFWNAVAKVQHAHSSLDGYVAHWFGLNQSKYQWALDDYYESKGGVDQVDAKVKDISRKTESV
ncbi:uncharacterized protein LOC141688817 [Apium graveolens]|uniref:uncharacterized protein LOC141688817 n=1 Tax=Apium graveolens TaxID=4045 RepID=UPI003D79584A